jgi:hypothetical protein
VTARDPADVKQAVDSLIAERRAETQVAECLNCNATAFVVRRRWSGAPGISSMASSGLILW